MSATDDHLGDEALSAFLDGEATPSEAAHVASCAPCQARTEELAAAARAIGAPPSIAADRRDAAIAAAMATRVVPLASRRFRPPVWALGAVAAALLAAVLIPSLANRHADRGQDATTSAAADNARPTPEAKAQLGAPAPVYAGDLGPLDAAALRPRITSALQPTGGDTAAGAGGSSGAPNSSSGSATAAAAPVCADALARTDPGLGSLRLVGRATVHGRAGEVLAYGGGGAPDELRVFVVALDDCADILLYASFTLG
jgi:hypothetical protein